MFHPFVSGRRGGGGYGEIQYEIKNIIKNIIEKRFKTFLYYLHLKILKNAIKTF